MYREYLIGSVKHPDLAKTILQEYKLIQDEEDIVNLENNENCTIYKLKVLDDKIGKLADILANIFVKYLENIYVANIISCQYYYFSPEERKIIEEKAKKVLHPCDNEHSASYKERRKKRIKEKIIRYLEYNNEFILEGFFMFRLKDYLYELEIAVEEAVDDYLMEKEYNEFIRLLKYFVEIQEPKMEVVHVILEKNGFFRLYDKDNNYISSDYFEGLMVDLINDELNYEDILISTLITIAPESIVLHNPKNSTSKNTIKTIKNVFEEKLSECRGCEKCSYLNHSKN